MVLTGLPAERKSRTSSRTPAEHGSPRAERPVGVVTNRPGGHGVLPTRAVHSMRPVRVVGISRGTPTAEFPIYD